MTQCEVVLECLRRGPRSQRELRIDTENCIMAITARISELRNEGFVIENRKCQDGYKRYFLAGEPRG